MSKNKKIVQKIYLDEYKLFPIKLKQLRLEKNWTRKVFAEKIGKKVQQVTRYEIANLKGDNQKPPLDVFIKICSVLQVDANSMLGVIFKDEEIEIADELKVVRYKLVGDALHWWCPNCGCENITYNNFSKNIKLLKKQSLQCEYDNCCMFYSKLEIKK